MAHFREDYADGEESLGKTDVRPTGNMGGEAPQVDRTSDARIFRIALTKHIALRVF